MTYVACFCVETLSSMRRPCLHTSYTRQSRVLTTCNTPRLNRQKTHLADIDCKTRCWNLWFICMYTHFRTLHDFFNFKILTVSRRCPHSQALILHFLSRKNHETRHKNIKLVRSLSLMANIPRYPMTTSVHPTIMVRLLEWELWSNLYLPETFPIFSVSLNRRHTFRLERYFMKLH